jgi:hypothetical protein
METMTNVYRPVPPMYSPEFVYSFKDKTELTDQLLLVFEGINELFKTSSQYMDMKKRINLNVKWRLKKKEEMSVVNLIFNAMNRICSTNYMCVFNEIKNIVITSDSDLDKLVTLLITKMTQEEQFIKSYVHVMYELFKAGKWMTQGDDGILTFRQAFMNKMQDIYNNMDTDKYNLNNRVYFQVIGKLYEQRIIGEVLMQTVMDDLQNKYTTQGTEQYIEYWIALWLCYKDYKRDYIMGICDKLSKRLQFMLADEKVNILDPVDIVKSSVDYSNYITYIDEYNNVTEMLKDVGQTANYIGFLIHVVRYTIDNPKDLKLIIKIVNEGVQMKAWKKQDVLTVINNIKNTELDEILLDAPYYESHIHSIITECGLDKDPRYIEKQDKDYRYKKNKNGNKSVR